MSSKLHRILAERNDKFFEELLDNETIDEIGMAVLHVRENIAGVALGKLRAIQDYLESGKYDKSFADGETKPSESVKLKREISLFISNLTLTRNRSILDYPSYVADRYMHYMVTGEELKEGQRTPFKLEGMFEQYDNYTIEELSDTLRRAVDEGDPNHVGVLAKVISERGERITKTSSLDRLYRVDSNLALTSAENKQKANEAFEALIAMAVKGVLYGVWINGAVNSPSATGKAIANCTSGADFDDALAKLNPDMFKVGSDLAASLAKEVVNLHTTYLLGRIKERQSETPDWEQLYNDKCEELEALQNRIES